MFRGIGSPTYVYSEALNAAIRERLHGNLSEYPVLETPAVRFHWLSFSTPFSNVYTETRDPCTTLCGSGGKPEHHKLPARFFYGEFTRCHGAYRKTQWYQKENTVHRQSLFMAFIIIISFFHSLLCRYKGLPLGISTWQDAFFFIL